MVAQFTTSGFLLPTFSPMRASPSFSASASLNIDDNVAANYTQSSVSLTTTTPASTTSVRVVAGNFTGLTAYRTYTLTNAGGYLLLSSEL
jgi:hypothetical protein